MFLKKRRKRLPLKTVFYMSFLFFIVIPILIVLVAALIILNQQFKKQAIENIKRAQEAIIADLESDEDTMSMRLSHMIYTNNNEILRYAAETDTNDPSTRNEYENKLSQTVNLVLEPVKDIISVSFYMKDGKKTYVLNEITRSQEEIKQTKWYQAALEKKNTVCIGYFDTASTNDVYRGSKKDSLILVFALAPDVMTDRSQKVEMVMYYQTTGAAERIRSYNKGYLAGKNKLGIIQIKDADGAVVFSTQEDSDFSSDQYICIKSPVKFNNAQWYVESYIKSYELTSDFWDTAMLVLGAAILILLLAGYYSSYLLRSIVRPIEEISGGLRQVEEGNLEVHISPKGQFEIRTMIHQFNAMVRRLKVLVYEYEEKIKSVEKTPEDYFAAMIRGEMLPEEINKRSKEFFMESYSILGIYVEQHNTKEKETDYVSRLVSGFERNPRFASRCILYMESASLFLVFYRITEKDYSHKIITMAEELRRMGNQEIGVQLMVCIGQKKFGFGEFEAQIKEIRDKMCLHHVRGNNAILNLEQEKEKLDRMIELSKTYEKMAGVLYTADEKNLTQEKERMFELFNGASMEEIRLQVYACILALGIRFQEDNLNLSDVFGQQYNYVEKIDRIDDLRSMKLWVTNYFAWVKDYTASKLNVSKTDVIVRAKRYIADHYEEADLSLTRVAEYVGLNEKYFTNRFTKECGETFSTYVTELRIQKSKELLKSTSFKVYEIAEMVGYYNVEHFNRMFKKINGISPAQYRKSE
ncbi:MAG TPA: helix-turn-helix domain-containing protein [Clostridiales bacterium]|nr:helix-turn-helix domain-containing protein [Clostridiales bacterium]